MKLSSILLMAVVTRVYGILPDFGFGDGGPGFESGMTGSENLPIFDVNQQDVSRVAKSAREGLSIDELTEKLQSKVNTISGERSNGGVPAKSIRELEDLMAHPTWLTDTSKGRSDNVISKNRRIYVVPAPGENPYPKPAKEDQMDHIKEVITKFNDLKPKAPITDNRITKFVFTHDADLATSRTVQQHNREVEAAFMDFNKKLEETLNAKNNKKIENEKHVEKEMLDRSVSRVVNFLDKSINKLREGNIHKQVCRKHKSHSRESMPEKDYMETLVGAPKKMSDMSFGDVGGSINHAGMMRFNEMAQTREGLENALLGLNRPRGGPYKRHVSLKSRRGHPSQKFQPKKLI